MGTTCPVRLSIADNENNGVRELNLTFQEDFRCMEHGMRIAVFNKYISDLGKNISIAPDGPECQCMKAVQQVSEQLLPYIVSDDLPLEETIVIELPSDSPFCALMNRAS